MSAELGEMIEGAWRAQTERTREGAGVLLAMAGWAVFPIPDGKKFDEGARAQTYRAGGIDAGVFSERSEDVKRRWDGNDVNLGLTPARCAIPLVAVDLDGNNAILNFWQAGLSAGETEEEMRSWMRCATARVEGGRHVYFAAPDGVGYRNSQHAWGGEIRSAFGHVVAPPSRTATGAYVLAGEKIVTAPAWVIEGMNAKISNGDGTYTHFTRDELGEIVAELSDERWPGTKYGAAGLSAWVKKIQESGTRAGAGSVGRNPTMNKAVNRALDLALEGHLQAQPAIEKLMTAYLGLFAYEGEEEQAVRATQVLRSVNSWCSRKEGLSQALRDREGAYVWAEARSREARNPAHQTGVWLARLENAKSLREAHRYVKQLMDIEPDAAVKNAIIENAEIALGDEGRLMAQKELRFT